MTNDWKKEFREKYDFSESKTLEYDNLVGIEDFIQSLLDKQIEEIEKMGCLNEFVLPNIYKKTGLVRKSDVLTKLKEL